MHGLRLTCSTCPYVYNVHDKDIASDAKLERKGTDEILGGDEAWKNVERTEAICPSCDHNEAFFRQVQTRSADEPMTTFLR